MAVTFTQKIANSSTTDGTSVTTASWAPSANKAYLIFVTGDRNAASPSTPTASGNGITWVQVFSLLYDASTIRLTCFRGRAGASPTTEATTFDFGGVTHESFMWSIVEVNGEDTSGTDASGMIQQTKTVTNGTSATPTLTFDASTNAANSLIAACARAAATTSITSPTGWTDVSGPSVSTPSGFLRVSKLENAADDTTDFVIGGSPTNHAIGQIEIKVAGAAGPGPTLHLLSTANGDGWGDVQLGGSAPSTATMSTGWTVAGTAADNYSEMQFGTERAANTFSGTAAPAASPNNTLKNGWRYGPTPGVHAAGDWPVTVGVIAVDAGGTQDGALRMRMFSSSNADGSSSTELTGAVVQLSTVTNLTTSTQQECTGTLSSIPEIPAGKYLFFCAAWRITGAAS